MIDVAGHLAYVALAIGQVGVWARRRWGGPARIAGSLGWAVIGWYLGLSSIVLWSLVFAAVDWRGWRHGD